jgi:sulfonate transport system permease protein
VVNDRILELLGLLELLFKMTTGSLAYHNRLIRLAAPWLVPIGLLLFWQIFAASGLIPHRILPSPVEVMQAGFHLTVTGEMPAHLWESSQRAVIGLLIGGTIGFVFALLNGLFGPAHLVLDSSLQMLRNIPHLAMIPLVILWFGIGEPAKMFLIVVGVFFPIYVNTVHGIRSTDPKLIEMGRIYGLTPWELLVTVVLPSALPSILVGLRYGLGIMWLTLIVAETIACDNGIGYMTMNAREFLQTDVVLVGILLYALLGKLADSVTQALERWLLRWNPAYR